jgi:hypothetical protein
MNPQTEGTEQQGPSGVPFVNDPAKPANDGLKPDSGGVNDPGNEDPGWGLDDAQVPLIDDPDQD